MTNIREMSFAEYVQTKQQLRESISKTPIYKQQYSVFKYCRLPLGESRDDSTHVNCKPKHVIEVTWRYISEDVSPELVSICVPHAEFDGNTYQTSDNMRKWLKGNTRELYS